MERRQWKNESAWEFMLESLFNAGFTISSVWPMRSEPVSEKADSTRILIVARKGTDRKSQITRRGFINTLKHELPEKIQAIMSGHVSSEDELLSCVGQGLWNIFAVSNSPKCGWLCNVCA